MKFLGVYLDENLTWNYHIQMIENKVAKSIGILYRARKHLNRHCLKKIYFSFIHCYINYSNIAWASTHKSIINEFISSTKACIKDYLRQR